MNFRKAILFAATAAAGAALAGAASAQDAITPTVSFNAGVSNDYVFRGVSQTNGDMQFFGGADVSAGPLYAGAWVSNVDFGDSTDAEWDVYAGFKPTLGVATLDLGVIHYGYMGDPKGSGYGNWEFKGAASVPAGPATVGAAVFYSPDGFGAVDDAIYYEVNAAYPVNDKVSLSAAVGRQSYEGPGDYTTWNVGATFAFLPHLALDVRYHDNNHGDFGKFYNDRVAVTLKATFP
jgi:uncharacterized protein (TIGR02001 family)